jgi:Holliday junction resolvase
MSQKQKGSNAEREIIHMFWQTPEWAACRVAGSGSNKYPSPDIIAANVKRKLAIECKTSKTEYQYLDKKEILELQVYSRKTNAEPWIAIKFSRTDWRFIQIKDLKETGKHFMATRGLLKEKGISFTRLLSEIFI